MPQVCSICTSDRAAIINSHLAANRSMTWIEKEMKSLGKPTKAETVSRHLTKCLNGSRVLGPVREAANGGSVGQTDFAIAVRAEAQKLLEEGRLSIRTEHGLTAQALLDRRAEKQADRQLMVELAGLLSGARRIEGPPEDLIEGEWAEVTGLAPPELTMAE